MVICQWFRNRSFSGFGLYHYGDNLVLSCDYRVAKYEVASQDNFHVGSNGERQHETRDNTVLSFLGIYWFGLNCLIQSEDPVLWLTLYFPFSQFYFASIPAYLIGTN